MALKVEDGSGFADSNSFGSIAGARAYASDRGIDFSALSDGAVSAFLIKGTDYLESRSSDYFGQPSTTTQALSWPRVNVVKSDGTSLPSSGAGSIPQALINALYQLCIEQNNGINPLASTDYSQSGFVVSEKVDVIETRYSERIGTTKSAVMPAVDSLLRGLLRNQSSSGLVTVRM